MNGQMKNPSWWTEDHTKGWEGVKEAFRRDWEQTKADFSKTKGQKLDQQVGDTVKQAIGKERIPPPGEPNHADAFGQVEPAYRFGYGARLKYGSAEETKAWNDQTEKQLSQDWSSTGAQQSWSDARQDVRKAWDMPGSGSASENSRTKR
jgi:hypothetical protein